MAEATKLKGDVTTSEPSFHAGKPHAQVQASRAAGDRDGISRANIVAYALLELFDIGSDAEPAASQHLCDEIDIALGDIGLRHRRADNAFLIHRTLRAGTPTTVA
ncbi:hypothetical protein T7740_17260 [Bradyrhizobium diazoefficiens]|nr:hypothetical protein [Bradyrhizobium diazoefficiens]WRJ69444.1 hypothetical protein T7740_17260 [Bradyrhizobium diazoefficiens]